MGEYFRYAGASTKTFGKLFKTEFNTIEKVARERVKDLQTQYISLGRDANGALKAISVRPLKLDMNDLATQTAITAQKQQLFNQLLRQGSTNLLNFGKNTQWAGRQLMVGFTIPLSIFGSMAAKTFMDLEKQAIRFKRVYGDAFSTDKETEAAIENMKNLAKEFTKYGVEVEKTLELAADAAQMGLKNQELTAQVTEATRLAVLGEVEQQEALRTTISVTNAFGIAASDLAKKIDFLNAVENETVTAISDLTIAIPKAGPVVRQLGGGIEELAFFLTAMKEGGINASEGANALKSGLASLINPTEKSSEMLKVFGINIKEIRDNARGDIKKLVIDFANALDTLDPSQRAQAIEQLFGKFQFSRISTLFQNVIKEGTQAQKVLELSNATTAELAALSSKELRRVEESTTFRFEAAIQKFQAAIAPIGEEFLKLITPIIEFATKIIEKFNSLSDGAKGFITGLVALLGLVGPVALMTFGLLANGIANILKGFNFVRELFQKTGKQSTILGEQFDYLTTEQLQAAAVAASLDQVHQQLIQTFSSEAGAVQNLADVYRRAFNEQQRFDTGRAVARQAGMRLASGIVSVPGPKGAGDVVPAMLSPGEAVIPADKARKYAPLVQGMIAGNIPGFNKGVMLGMPRSGKGTQRNREEAEQIFAMFQQSSYANVPPRQYGHQLAKSAGHSFPLFGVGGVYVSPEGKRVFVKPVMDETAAKAEMRATEITRKAHGLKAPEQRIVVMLDPTDVRRQRKFLALESNLDPTFMNNDPMAVFNEDQYFKQLVASLLRVDKDLSASNVYKDVVADVGASGVFSRASGLRDYADVLPSMEEQAMINLLGIKGGAKRAFAESTLALMSGLTPQQYHQRMVSEIQQVLPLLKQTIASFSLTDPREIQVYDAMVKRLEQGLGVDWSKFYAIHSKVKPSKPKQSIPGYADGVLSVPGPKGKGDVTPAMLTPGEAVIPADKAKKYAGLIQAIIYGKIPGYVNSNIEENKKLSKLTQSMIAEEFGGTKRAGTSVNASHTSSFVPSRAMSNLAAAADLLGDELEDTTVTVVEHTRAVDAEGKAITKTTEKKNGKAIAKPVINTETKQIPLSEALRQYRDSSMVTGGEAYGATAIFESATRNQKVYRKLTNIQEPADPRNIGEVGSPETLQDVEYQGELAAKVLQKFSNKLSKIEQNVLESLVVEGERASKTLKSSSAAEEELKYIIDQRKKGIELRIASDTKLKGEEKDLKRQAVDAKIIQIKERYYQEIAEGASQEDALNKLKARMLVLALKESKAATDKNLTMWVGGSDISSNALRDSMKNAPNEVVFNPLNPRPEASSGRSVGDALAYVVSDNLRRTDQIVEGTKAELKKFASKTAIDYLESIENGFNEGFADFAEINSPSDRTARTIGKPLVEGVEQGALANLDSAVQAGEIIEETISDSAAAAAGTSRRLPRRASSDPAVMASLREQQGQAAAMETRSARNRRAGGQMVGRQMVTYLPNVPGDKEAKLAAAQQRQSTALQLSTAATVQNTSRIKETFQNTGKFNSMIMNGSFALSSLTGVLSMFGGQFAELNQTLFGVSTAFFALMQVTQALTGAKIAERIQTAAATAFGPAAIGAMGPKTLAQSATGLGGIFSKLGVFVKALFGPIGLVVAGLTALAGIIGFVVASAEEQKKKIDGLGNAAFITGDKLKKLGSLLGFTPKTTKFGENITQGSAAGRNQEESGLISELRGSEEFKTDFKDIIEALKKENATKQQAEAALAAQANQLFASGASQEQVDAYIRALAQEAGRSDLNLSFAKIDFTKEGKDKIVAAATTAATEYSKTFEKGLSATNQIAAKGSVGVIASSLQALKDGLANGLIAADDFNAGLSSIIGSLEGMSEKEQAFALTNIYEKLGIKETMEGIPNVQDQLLLLQADAAGLQVPQEYIDALKNSNGDPAAARAALGVRKQLTKQVAEQAKKQETLNKKIEEQTIIDEAIAAANKSLEERTQGLIDQASAYQLLIDKGYDAETAFELAGDASLVAGLLAAQAAGNATGKWEELEKILSNIAGFVAAQREAIKPPSSGTKEKSAYEEAIESLQQQRKEILNTNVAFNRLRKAGLDTASAMKIAEDPITAAALATTKVGSEKWKNLLNTIKQVQGLLSKKEIQALLRGGVIEKADKQSQITVSTALNRLGWTAEQIDKVLSDQEFTNSLAADLKDGKIDAKDLLNRLIQIKQLDKLDVALNFTTKEGAAEEFQKRYDKVVGYLEAKKARIQIEIDLELGTAQNEILAREAENLIADIQYEIDDYEAELTGIEEQEELINEKYDERKKALDKIAKSNDSIAKQQKAQLTLADALSQGDIAAAARAVQEIRAQQAQDRLEKQGDLLEVSKEKELGALRSKNGRSRKQIEEEIKKLKKQIFIIEEETLEPARNRIRLAGVEKERAVDAINAQILRWEVLAAKVNEAKLRLTPEEMDAMEYQAGLIADLLENWNNIEDKTAILTIIKKELGLPTDTGAPAKEPSGPDAKDDRPDGKTDGLGGIADGKADKSEAQKTLEAFQASGQNIAGFIKQQDFLAETAKKAQIKADQTASLAAFQDSKMNVAGFIKQQDSASVNSAVAAKSAAERIAAEKKNQEKILKDLKIMEKQTNSISILQSKGIKLAKGGVVKYMADGGVFSSLGTDTVPAMLTPGEFVVRKYAVDNFGLDKLKAINSGTYNGDSMYNYEVNVNVQTGANPDQIARAVIGQIKQIESQRIRGNRF
jgi:TP901 family phage tail tape measure protein